MKLLIRNLSRKTSEEELKALFVKEGAVETCVIVMDEKTGNSKGFGFVEMYNRDEALKTVKKLNDKEFAGSRIKVKVATK